MSQHRSRTKTTIAAVALMLALTVVFTLIGVDLARAALDASRIGRGIYYAGVDFGLNSVETQNLVAISAIVVLGLCALCIILVVGVLGRRPSVRHAAIGTFVVFAAVTLPLSIAEILSDDPSPTAAIGLLIGALDVAIVVLLLRPETLTEFERAEAERNRARSARRAERLARRSETSDRASEPG